MDRLNHQPPSQYSPTSLKVSCTWLEEHCTHHDSSCPSGPFKSMPEAIKGIGGGSKGDFVPIKGYSGLLAKVIKEPASWWYWHLDQLVGTFVPRFTIDGHDFILYPRRPGSYKTGNGTRYYLIDPTDHAVYVLGYPNSAYELAQILAHPNKFPLHLRYFKNTGGHTSWREELDQKAFRKLMEKIQGTL